ncbi:MAG: thrombospondin type 3 repeat-containing protein [Planctomycetes bacterium]|nr:thrombospondin type 3 repeat-containing protein [Planctomycetota bacterium]
MSGSDLCASSHRIHGGQWARWSTAVAIALGVGAAIAVHAASPRVVNATTLPVASDPDGDGLSTDLELAFGTDPYNVDSDGDGVSDAEELARHSSPTNSSDLPGSATASVGMGVTAYGAGVKVISAVYVADGTLNAKSLKLGLVKSATPVTLPKSALGSDTKLTVVPASTPGQLVVVYECPVSASVFRTSSGAVSLYSLLTGPSGLKVADAINLVRIDGVLCQRLVLTTQSGGSPGNSIQVAGPLQTGGVVFKPIGGGTAPATWAPGAICSQTTKLVGYSGGSSVNEVTAASCETGWDAFCAPSCAASVGSTVMILDPAVLVGG